MHYGYDVRSSASAVVAVLTILAAAQTPTHVLRLSDEVGQTNRYRLTFDIQMRAEYVSDTEPDAQTRQLLEALASGMGLHTAVEYEQRLATVEGDGTRVFEVRWHDFEFTGDIGGRPIAPPPTHVESTRDLLSHRARVRTTASGRTIDVTYSHPGLAGLARQFEQLQSALPTYLPEAPVRVGDRWTSVGQFPVDLSASAAGNMTLELEHTLLDVRPGEEGAVAVIGLSGTFSNLQGVEESRFGAPLHMEASLTGSAQFDIDHGRYIGGRYEIDMFALHAEGGVEVQLTGHANGTLAAVDTG
ncbi:MAG: hypothetical protein GTO46_10895 [Gemmatimonadetes bacterium]|nr:hypothetical protein [Gemmatimonadota bacterium]NIO32111.1 hypothetical protein [Gemmatimonadota bacterium]